MCAILRDERVVHVGSYRLTLYDFPPFAYQFMLVPARHREALTRADLEVAVDLARALGGYALFAGAGSGASRPAHAHLHCVPFRPPLGTPMRSPLGRHGIETVDRFAGRVRGIRIPTATAAERERLFAAAEAVFRLPPMNLVVAPDAVYVIPRSCGRAHSLGSLRMGAIEVVGMLCLRNAEQLSDYTSDPVAFHRRFLSAQAEVCVGDGELRAFAELLEDALTSGG